MMFHPPAALELAHDTRERRCASEYPVRYLVQLGRHARTCLRLLFEDAPGEPNTGTNNFATHSKINKPGW